MLPILKLARKAKLIAENLFDVDDDMSAEINGPIFQKSWEKEVKRTNG